MTPCDFVISRSRVQVTSPAPTLFPRNTVRSSLRLWGMIFAALWGLLCIPSPARAQSRGLVIPAVTLSALEAGDIVTTVRALESGRGREGNGLMAPIVTNKTAMIATKVGVTALTIWIAARLHREHPKIAKVALWSINGVMAGVVANNLAVTRR